MKQWLLIAALAFLVGLPAAQANTYDFKYSGTNLTSGTISAFGSLWTQIDGNYEVVTKITGSRNGAEILGIVPANPPAGSRSTSLDGSFWYDNVLIGPAGVSGGYFPGDGLLFTVSGLTGYVNLFRDGDKHVDATGAQWNWEVTNVQLSIAATPEPGFYGVLALGLGGLFVSVRRRRRA